MNTAYLSLGSNLGNRGGNLEKALEMLQSGHTRILTFSNVYETEPWGVDGQNKYLNQVTKTETNLEPPELLEFIQEIEEKCGRKRGNMRYEPRTLDIDILFYNSLIMVSEKLIIPHPLIHQRLFVLIPMSDIAPDFRHPVLGKTITELLARCEDNSSVLRLP